MGVAPASMALLGRAVTGRDLAVRRGGAERVKALVRGGALPNRVDVLIAAVAGGVDLFGYLVTAHSYAYDARGVGVLLLALSALCLVVRRRAPVVVLGAVVVLQVLSDVAADMPPRLGITLIAALYTVGLACRPLVSSVSALAVLAVLTTLSYRGPAEESFAWAFSSYVTAIALVLAVSAGVRHWQQQVELNRELLADRALTDERRRIARELHDIVAHHVTTMHLLSGAARANLERDHDAARSALLALESSGRVALGEMRQLLGVLRSDKDPERAPSAPQPGADDIDRLIADACMAGLPTTLEIAGEPRELPLPVGLALYRITQEALTNARKHAPGAEARVRLEYRANRVELTVRDSGSARVGRGGTVAAGPGGPPTGDARSGVAPTSLAPTGGGHGLVGMRERVAVHDGTFSARPSADGGFEVNAVLPVPHATTRPRPSEDRAR